MSPLYEISTTLREQGMLRPREHLVVACSGGQDSVALLFLLYQLQPQWKWQIAVSHCNHLWTRGSSASASRVAQMGISMRSAVQISVPGDSALGEMHARRWRWRCLARVSMIHGYTRVCTAHTASDRAETLISQLMHGHGQPMGWYRPGRPFVIRPALGTSRGHLGMYGRQWQLPLCIDSTNTDRRIQRSRIRYELLPYLRTWWTPKADVGLAKAAETWSQDSKYMHMIAHQLCCGHEWVGRDAVRLPQDVVARIPRSLQPRVMHSFATRALAFLAPTKRGVMPNEWLARARNEGQPWLIVQEKDASSWIRTSDEKSDYESDALDH